tara:strand:- start:216 stop:413 length:198 start_codon:yes stop_codon:yes gene_type:complete
MSKLVFQREDGYQEYTFKGNSISYFNGVYSIQEWFRDNTFESLKDAEKAINQTNAQGCANNKGSK